MLFLRAATRWAGARVQRRGTALRTNVMFVSNHLSWLDIPLIGGATGCSFVAKAELARAPLVGWLARLNRTVFVDREDRLGVADQINALRVAIEDTWAIAIFPEGTTTDGQSVLPFKTSMLRVLEPPPDGIMVQPVVLDYGALAEWIGWVGVEEGPNNLKRVLARAGTFPVSLHFLAPFDPRDFRGRKAIAKECQRRIEEAVEANLGKPLRPFVYDVGSVRYTAPAPPAAD